jgi:hypothetical protein
MGKIRLFKEILSCQDCLFSWEGHAHGFSRSHSVLTKKDRVLFIPDDIWYTFPESTDFDIEALFAELGWRPIESCPKCRSKNLFPPSYDTNSMTDIECEEIKYKHFEKINADWNLTETAKAHFV